MNVPKIVNNAASNIQSGISKIKTQRSNAGILKAMQKTVDEINFNTHSAAEKKEIIMNKGLSHPFKLIGSVIKHEVSAIFKK